MYTCDALWVRIIYFNSYCYVIWYTKYFIFVNLFLLSVNVLDFKYKSGGHSVLYPTQLPRWVLTNLYCLYCDRDTGMADGLTDDYQWTNFSWIRLWVCSIRVCQSLVVIDVVALVEHGRPEYLWYRFMIIGHLWWEMGRIAASSASSLLHITN